MQRYILFSAFFLLSTFTLLAQGPFAINGTVRSIQNEGVGQVILSLTDSNGDVIATAETECDGTYLLEGISEGETYFLHLEKNDAVQNGVSTFDRVLLSKHILGIELLGNPYNVYAADVNASGTVTVTDILWIQAVVLAIAEEFPSGNWHFFSQNDTQPSNDILVQLTADVNGWNFVAVKKGDVNQSSILCD